MLEGGVKRWRDTGESSLVAGVLGAVVVGVVVNGGLVGERQQAELVVERRTRFVEQCKELL